MQDSHKRQELNRKNSGLGGSVFGALVVWGAWILAIVILLGGSGRIFAVGDSVAIFRPVASALLFFFGVGLWVLRARRTAVLSFVVAAAGAVTIAPGFLKFQSGCTGACLKVYQKNLLSEAWPRYTLADDIINSGAEIVTLQEVSAHNRQFMANLFAHYTAEVSCNFRPAQEVAVLTTLPVVDETAFCLPDVGLAGFQLIAPNGQKVWALSIHLEWPFPLDQAGQSAVIADHIATLDGPVLIGGDFNMVPWGGSVHRIKQAAGNKYLGVYRNTYNTGQVWLPLPIDIVLVPQQATGRIEYRDHLGSDHMGVLAQIQLP